MAAENHSVGDAKMINFLKNVLGVTIPEPLSVVPANSRLELLNDIIKAYSKFAVLSRGIVEGGQHSGF